MFWGITLEHGKVYSQIVEMPFHISMAALGFSNLTDGATTIMVESEKADYALCTLQAGKIPQQPLDLNFTEGEEVKFFLEGNGGDVHLTGYLLETPREYEYDEDDVDALMSSEEDTSVSMEDDEDDINSASSDEEEEIANGDDKKMITEKELGGKGKLDKNKRESDIVKGEEDDEDDDGDGDSVDDEGDDDDDDDDDDSFCDESVSLQGMLTGDFDDSDDSDAGDNEWKPTKKKAGKKEKESKAKNKKLAKKNKGKSKTSQKPISQTLINLMNMDDSDDSSETDDNWEPGLSVSDSGTNIDNGPPPIWADKDDDGVKDDN